jgi:hypothetical protein
MTAHDEGYPRQRELETMVRRIAQWVERHPGATAGDMAGEELLEIVRSIAAMYEGK